MSEKFTSEALFGWQENGGEKKKIFKGTKALKPRSEERRVGKEC